LHTCKKCRKADRYYLYCPTCGGGCPCNAAVVPATLTGSQRLYRKKVAAGLCVWCALPRHSMAVKGRYCQEHYAAMSKRSKAWAENRKRGE